MNKLLHLVTIWLLLAANLLPIYLLMFSPLLHELPWRQMLEQYIGYLKMYAVIALIGLLFFLKRMQGASIVAVHHYFLLQLDLIHFHADYLEVKRCNLLLLNNGPAVRFARHLPIFIVRNARKVYLKNDAGAAADVQLSPDQLVAFMRQLVKGGFMYHM